MRALSSGSVGPIVLARGAFEGAGVSEGNACSPALNYRQRQ